MKNASHQTRPAHNFPLAPTRFAPRRRTLAILRATRYLVPSFSSSAMTQSLMQGMHSAYRQSIMPWTRSI